MSEEQIPESLNQEVQEAVEAEKLRKQKEENNDWYWNNIPPENVFRRIDNTRPMVMLKNFYEHGATTVEFTDEEVATFKSIKTFFNLIEKSRNETKSKIRKLKNQLEVEEQQLRYFDVVETTQKILKTEDFRNAIVQFENGGQEKITKKIMMQKVRKLKEDIQNKDE